MNKIKLDDLVLQKGSHITAEQGMCVMEAVAYFANEPHSDRPTCACPVLTSFMIILNDRMQEDERQLLKPFIQKLIGTRDGNAQKRANILAWTSVVEFTPHCLKLIGLNKEADALTALQPYDWSAAASAAWRARRGARPAEKLLTWP